ncbi:MAG: AAA family ATPase [Deltaproteobacteria bacterium]|nr:AAA family ATPase [Deltaproteobacteria bacterium]
MYEKFFYLKERPFHITPDPQFLYLSKGHGQALDLMAYGIRDRRGFILLTGEVGAGKTTRCRALMKRLRGDNPAGGNTPLRSALVLNPLMSTYDLLKTINADFGLAAPFDTLSSHNGGITPLGTLNGFLLKTASTGGNAALIVDEAQTLTKTSLEMLRMLSNLETEKQKLLQILLVGQPELDERLKLRELRQLNQRVAVRCRLAPLDLADTGAYIEKRIATAGGRGSVLISKDAVKLIHVKSGGVPRSINITCDRALTAAFVEGKRVVDRRIAGMAVKELESEGFLKDDSREGPLRALISYIHRT